MLTVSGRSSPFSVGESSLCVNIEPGAELPTEVRDGARASLWGPDRIGVAN